MRYVILPDRTKNRETIVHIADKPYRGYSQTRCGRHFQGADIFETVDIDDPYDRKCEDCFHRQEAA